MRGTHQAFRVTDEQESPGLQTIIIFVDEPVLGLLVEIDHDITAENNLKFGAEWKRLHQVEPLEFNGFSNHGLEPVMSGPVTLAALKVSSKNIRCNRIDLGRLIYTVCGGAQHFCGDVCRHDIEAGLRLSFRKLMKANGEGVGLFTAGATGAPDIQLFLLGFCIGQNRREDRFLKKGKVLRLPEETGQVGGDGIEHMDELFTTLIVHQKLVILFEPGHFFRPEASAESGSNQFLFALMEVDAGLFINKAAEKGELPVGKL